MPDIKPIREFVFTDHALNEMARRQISEEDVKTVLANPEQMEMAREGRAVYQSRLQMGEAPRTNFAGLCRYPPHTARCSHCVSDQ
ncbi:MAG TPA: DUF4258 domain-containing protein [Anaerolineales bacterium]|jgi:hypothetical protein|nr:DUF4258 domain-containing protein [Anaerolineales bacterium]